MCAFPSAAQAANDLPAPLRLEEAVRVARANRAEIGVARARARASAARPDIVSSLPDPMVMASIDHWPIGMARASGSLTAQQEFPLSSVLSRRRRAAEARAQRDRADTARVELDVELDAMSAYFMLLEKRRNLAVVRELEGLSRQLAAVSEAHYASGHGVQADALRADNEVSRFESERIALAAEVNSAEAMLNAALGRSALEPVPELSPPRVDRAPPSVTDAIAKALAQRPELAAMRHERAGALAEVDAMQSMYKPMALVRAGPAYDMQEGVGLMLMVGVTVPLWRSRLDAGSREANAMVGMANEELAAMRNMIQGEVASARSDVVAARVRLRALRDRIVPTAAQTVDSALASYAATQTSAVSVVESLRTLWDVRLEEVMAEARLGIAWARLDRAIGKNQRKR